MNEASKLRERWKRDGTFDRYFSGTVLDVGCGADPIVEEAVEFDKPDGNGQFLEGVADAAFDTVFSSHFLEHVADPLEALLNQWRVLRPGGYLIFLVPDEDLYEQGCFPSVANPDHKHSFNISKDRTWSPVSRNLIDLLRYLPDHKILSLRTIDTNYDYTVVKDHTADPTVEAAIEGIIQKSPTQPTIMSNLSYILNCPNCSRAKMIIRGIDTNGRIEYTCGWCGDVKAFGMINPPTE